MRDLKNNLDAAQSIAPAVYTADADGAGVDLQGYDAAMLVFHPGTVTDGTHTPKVQESDSLATGYTDVATADLEGTLVALASDVPQRVGYKGSKRYIKAYVTVTGSPVTGGVYGAEAIRGLRRQAPV